MVLGNCRVVVHRGLARNGFRTYVSETNAVLTATAVSTGSHHPRSWYWRGGGGSSGFTAPIIT